MPHNNFSDDSFSTGGGLRAEIAAAAAALIAEEGLDYASAKRKAYERITGGKGSRIARELLPSNEEVEDAVREYQQIFQSDTQPQRLQSLRKKALSLMQLLTEFTPHLTGAVANGTAGEHSDIHLQCFADNAKALGIFLHNQNIHNDAAHLPHFRKGESDVEALVVQWQGELATIAVYPESDGRNIPKSNDRPHPQRLSLTELEKILRQND